MPTYIARRLGGLVIQVLVVVSVFFVVLRLMPANPASQAAGPAASQQQIEHAKQMLGLNTSIPAQLWHYISGIGQLDLGHAWSSGDMVLSDIVNRFPLTITVVTLAFVLALIIAVPLGRAAAARPGGTVDRGALGYSLLSGAQPDFFWGLILAFLLAVKLHTFPVPTGVLSTSVNAPPTVTHFILIDSLIAGNFTAFFNALWHLALPIFTLAFVLTGPLMKMTRESVITVVQADYILYARSAGLPERQIRRMMLANALGPILTLTAILFAFDIGGAVLIEYVFSLNGLGLYSLNSTLNLDYPAVQGAVLVMTTFSLLIFLGSDLVQAAVDPRVRLGAR